MVQILPLFLATLATISPVVQAVSCTPGITYCGRILYKYGWRGLDAHGLYYCVVSGEVTLTEICNVGCLDGGAGNSDTCF
ncbi:hypothetical protein E4U44_001951 [Claviceps purpurea]|nr:hypothetical protein E4U44_001951 [Claviceps purpurea]